MIATPSFDVYGSDLQMLQSAAALREAGCRVVVVAPRPGRLVERLSQLGAETQHLDFPVLVRASASAVGIVGLALDSVRALPRMRRTLRRLEADVVYVNTVTLPWWLLAGRLARVPTVCHVHEAERRDRRIVRFVLTLPLLLARLVIVNSQTTWDTITEVVPQLNSRLKLVYNGVDPPPTAPVPSVVGQGPARLVVVGRLSPRKAPQVVLEAASLLRREGREVQVDLCGTPAEGMEWFSERLRERAEQPDLAGAVIFSGYSSPIWPSLADAHVVVAPSLGESFGNAVVEGQLARRPVVATAVGGHLETVSDGETGLLVPCEDPPALAAVLARVLDDPDLAEKLARQGRDGALANFTSSRYREQVRSAVSELASG